MLNLKDTSSPAQPILNITDLSMSFGGVQALEDVSFTVKPGSIHSIIGPNGAGKTTLLNCISGQYKPEGSIRFGETELTGIRAHERIHLGIARTFQHINVFPEQTVLENLMVGGHHRLKRGLFSQCLYWSSFGNKEEEVNLLQEAIIILDKLEMTEDAKAPAAELSYGKQKRLELGRALMARPKLLLLDEPMAGMTQTEKKELSQWIIDINREGMTIVMIEHDMSVVQSVSNHTVVLDFGRNIAEGTPQEVVKDDRVRKAYLGDG
jgi:branched-chain amino acid transport system ATP-binding protein